MLPFYSAGSLTARLLPQAARLHSRMITGIQNHWPQETVQDQCKRPRPALKLFSTCLIHEYNSSAHTTRVHAQELQYRKRSSPRNGGGGGGGVTASRT